MLRVGSLDVIFFCNFASSIPYKMSWLILIWLIMNLETEYLSGDIVMAKVEGFPHWPAIVIEVTEDESYRVVFFVQGKEALLGANDLKKFEGREETISETGNKKYKQLNEAISLAENVLSLRKKRGYNAMEENLLIRASQSSFQENKSKKVEKKR